MLDQLSLRPTLIAGETAPNDFQVIWDGFAIGRILGTTSVGGKSIWSWSIILPSVPQSDAMRGRAENLELAKAAFQMAWQSLRIRLTDAEIEQARRQIEDRSRPWQQRDNTT